MVTDSGPEYQGRSFSWQVRRRARERRSWLCVGLDPDTDRLPAGLPATAAGVVDFCRAVVQATMDRAVAFKLNFAFFEALGPDGWRALDAVRRAIPGEIPVIADAKRGDVGSTARAYARAVFDRLGFDAVTLSPYLGWDGIAPFAAYRDRGLFVLCKTSNANAGELQDLPVEGEPFYLRVARTALRWPAGGELGLVVGATHPEALARVRSLGPETLLLVPGVGAQGGSVDQAISQGANASGDNALIAVSREILYASSDADFREAAAAAAERHAAETWRMASHAHS